MGRLLTSQNELVPEEIFNILHNRRTADDQSLPDTGVDIDMERVLSPVFIVSPGYGTRSSTIISIDREDRVQFIERTYIPNSDQTTTVEYEFRIE